MLLDPLFGDIQDQKKKKSVPRSKSEPKSIRGKNSSFATSVAVNVPAGGFSTTTFSKCIQTHHACMWILMGNTLSDCSNFKTQARDNKVEFLRSHGYCFSCLPKGHVSKNCKKRLQCQVCQMEHPTVLHKATAEIVETPISSALVSADDATGARRDCALAIVPVRIKVAKGSRYIQTYAFLDPGSTATFCTENLMNQLKVHGRKTEILLRTCMDL